MTTNNSPLYLPKGGLVGLPPAGEIAVFSDANGNVFVVDETGAVTPASSARGAGTTVTLGAAANIIDFPGLSGDTDGDYLVTFDLIGGASASGIITVKINGSAANQATGQWFYTRGSTAGNATTSDLRVDSTIAAGTHTTGSFLLTSKSGKWRFFKVSVCNSLVSIEANGAFEDTTTVINEVSINAATAAGFAIGSTATLQKLFRN
jgi:hypothetical protein